MGIHEECVDAGVLASSSKVKPSYVSVRKQGKASAPPRRGYALATTALSSIALQSLSPLMKKRPPSKSMEPCTRTEYNKTVKVMAEKEYLAYLFIKQAD